MKTGRFTFLSWFWSSTHGEISDSIRVLISTEEAALRRMVAACQPTDDSETGFADSSSAHLPVNG
jgi:hypothetical protein